MFAFIDLTLCVAWSVAAFVAMGALVMTIVFSLGVIK